jgi:hypothetical protein
VSVWLLLPLLLLLLLLTSKEVWEVSGLLLLTSEAFSVQVYHCT